MLLFREMKWSEQKYPTLQIEQKVCNNCSIPMKISNQTKSSKQLEGNLIKDE